ncbi:MAG: GIY-YIG nuclease family protein [Candidatus Spechtbacterales bacterium]|nr:GIY-YIG nuclease family protein [Candidatus Spechtbacterales bacterium]
MYILKSRKTKKLYIGYTSDLRKRVKQHNKGYSKSTKNGVPWELRYYEAYTDQQDATEREQQLKRFAKSYAMLKKRIKKSLED